MLNLPYELLFSSIILFTLLFTLFYFQVDANETIFEIMRAHKEPFFKYLMITKTEDEIRILQQGRILLDPKLFIHSGNKINI